MRKLTVQQIADAVGGQVTRGDAGVTIKNVCTDTRKLKPGDLFIALTGERFDGHDYVKQAVEAGAAALMLAKPTPDLPSDIPVVMVGHTLTAMQKLAKYNRSTFNIPVIGITGSNGKTTTKDLVAAVMSGRFSVLKTKGNFNNEIGLPLTLLELDERYNAVVVEMGMRGKGQIDALCLIADINAAVITNIGEAHLELLGSVENIAEAKGEILEHISSDGFAVIPASELALSQAHRCRGRIITFGVNCQADYTAADIEIKGSITKFTAVTPVGKKTIELPLAGRHNISNALAALAVGVNCGLSLEEAAKGLTAAEITGMRLQVIETGSITIINDTYNANPDSVKAALKTLQDMAGRRRQVAVLGSMFELGPREEKGHYEVGLAAANADLLVAVGELAEKIAEGGKAAGVKCVEWFGGKTAAIEYLKKSLRAHDVVLIKGSRGMKMEEIAQALQQEVQ